MVRKFRKSNKNFHCNINDNQNCSNLQKTSKELW